MSEIAENLSQKLVVLVPAYNEERFIGSVVLKIKQYVDTVVVVDDGSSDSTAEIAKAAGAIVIAHEKNQGKGIALNTGFKKVLEYAPLAVVTIDGDWQHMPEQIMQVAKPVLDDEADIVVGSRYLKDESNVPVSRVIGHAGFTKLTNILSGTSLTDSQSGYRAFSPHALEKLIFSSQSFSVESEMQFLIKEHNLRVVETPIIIRYDDKPKRPVVVHGVTVLNGILTLVARYRPLLFFGTAGAISMCMGLIFAGFAIHGFVTNEVLPVGTSLLVVIFTVSGMFLSLVAIVLWSLRSWVDDLKATFERHL